MPMILGISIQRLTTQIALHDVATQVLDDFALSYSFHAFGSDHQAQAVAHSGHRVHQLLRAGHGVDLELADRQLLQVRRRRIARTKVI
jgi:hypothetical protein